MPDSPVKAKFLSVQDKAVAIERLRMNQMGMETGEWRWSHVSDAARDLKTWLWFAIMFVVSIPSGGISAFGPLIIESFGFGDFTTILFNMPFGAVQMVSTLGGAWLADRLRMKSPVLLLLCLPPVAGCAILLAVGRGAGDRAVLLVGYYLISVYPGISPLVYSWSGQNTAGDTKRKVTTAVIFVGASAGNIVGPLLFRPAEAPRYTRGLTANLVLFVLLAILVMLGMLLIRVLNARQASKRRAMGKPEHVVDLSMADQKQLDQSGDADGVALENGLDDLTDRQNEDFVYVY